MTLRRQSPERVIHVPLVSVTASLPVFQRPSHEDILVLREAIREVFAETDVSPETQAVFDGKVSTRSLVTRIREGSLEIDVILQAVVSLPWTDIAGTAKHFLEHGLHCLKEIGSIAGGLCAVAGVACALRSRLVRRKVLLEKEDIKISPARILEIDERLGLSGGRIDEFRARLLHHDAPLSVGTVLASTELLRAVFRGLPTSEPHLGGGNLIRDLNLFTNGVNRLDDLKRGDVVFFNNVAALGLSRDDHPESLHAAASTGQLRLRRIVLTTHRRPESEWPRPSRPIDADSLEDAPLGDDGP